MALRRSVLAFLLLAIIFVGCNHKTQLPVVPVEGKVTYNGKPLTFGGVMFQPDHGPPALASIQPDGTFRLATYAPDDGAVLGHHQIRITCYESQRPGGTQQDSDDAPPEQCYIPKQYTILSTSGLTAEVEPTNPPFIFDLK